jgi:hypothetical protein
VVFITIYRAITFVSQDEVKRLIYQAAPNKNLSPTQDSGVILCHQLGEALGMSDISTPPVDLPGCPKSMLSIARVTRMMRWIIFNPHAA